MGAHARAWRCLVTLFEIARLSAPCFPRSRGRRYLDDNSSCNVPLRAHHGDGAMRMTALSVVAFPIVTSCVFGSPHVASPPSFIACGRVCVSATCVAARARRRAECQRSIRVPAVCCKHWLIAHYPPRNLQEDQIIRNLVAVRVHSFTNAVLTAEFLFVAGAQTDATAVQALGESSWASVVKMGHMDRTPKQCRERWLNYLKPTINHGPWTQEEDDILIRQHAVMGNSWAQLR